MATTAPMEHRRLGESDLEVSVVGLGTNNFGRRVDQDGSTAVVHAALDAGVNFFDTANIYGGGDSERFLGAALKGIREKPIIATKFGMQMPGEPADMSRGRRDYVMAAVDASLERLGLEHIDLYQLHQPDATTPIEETLGALNELVEQGKVRHVGCSNFAAAQLRDADATARARAFSRFESVQNQYSLLRREVEEEVVPAAVELRVSVIPYFPLASGLLTGKYRRDAPLPPGSRLAGSPNGAAFLNDENMTRVEALERWAKERGRSLLEVAIGGLAAMPAVVSVIAGATRPEQVRANAAAGGWRPTAAELEEIRSLTA